jgi:GH15 family glucan-1,4-alpha-glucosidase
MAGIDDIERCHRRLDEMLEQRAQRRILPDHARIREDRLEAEHHLAIAWADAKRSVILDRAYNRELGFFTQAFDGQYPDASNSLLPAIGLIDPLDPRFTSTVRAYERELAPHGLMLRYKHPDDFGHTTSAFSICSFWWVEALAMMGEVDEAVALFRRLETYANPLGLFSEDIEPETGALLGNFPQAYTHVGLIHAAITIGEILDARSGSFKAWS